jgi:PBP1b-binding outer membrane lipoprotein LpoB
MNRILFIIAIAVALIATGCGSGDQQAGKTSVTPTPVTPVVEQPKPSPTTPVEPPAVPPPAIPASIKPKSASAHRVRYVAQAPAQVAPVVVEDIRSIKLADEILNLPLQERLEWTKQEFAKRGITNVHDDR